MSKPREFKFWYNSYAAKWEARQISGPDPEREITVREVMPDEDKTLAHLNHLVNWNYQAAIDAIQNCNRVTRALEKAKEALQEYEMEHPKYRQTRASAALSQIEAIERGENGKCKAGIEISRAEELLKKPAGTASPTRKKS